METLQCIIQQSIKNDLPEFDFSLIFENEFFNDEYNVISEKSIPLNKQISYKIMKNNSLIGTVVMKNNNLENFMLEALYIIDDCDISNLYNKNVKKDLFEYHNKFVDSFDSRMQAKPSSLIGEIYKMRRAAGLI